MKLATRTRYGVRLMVDLAEHGTEGVVPLKDVAARQDISKKYLGQVAAPLVAAGLVRVERGVAGGYELARSPESITLADIVEATEGGFNLLDCTNDEWDDASANAKDGGSCGSETKRLASDAAPNEPDADANPFRLDLRCPRIDDCTARTLWGGLENAMRAYLEGITLEALANKQL